MSRFKLWQGVLLLGGLALSLLPSPVAAADCTQTQNSWVLYDSQWNYAYCGGSTNSVCTQCSADYYPIGYTICTRDSTGVSICIDYQY